MKKRSIIFLGLFFATLLLGYILVRMLPYFALFLFQQALQSRMHCWVKVVDQEGKAVSGYKVEVTEHGSGAFPFLSRGARVRMYQTGPDGLFEYRSKGSVSLVVFGHWDTQWQLNPKHLIQGRTLSVTALHHRTEIQKNPDGYPGSQKNPYLLHVFTLGRPQRLLYQKVVIKLQDPKRYFCMDILSGKTWESEKPEGDVAMADGFGTAEHPAPCSVTIKAGPHCEVAPVLDDWGLGPPKDGYSKEICWPKSWRARNWSLPGLRFYYRLNRTDSPSVLYGKVKFGLGDQVNGAVIECFTNLQGTRNLYFKGYEKSVSSFDPCQIQDYVSPPVRMSQLQPVAGRARSKPTSRRQQRVY